MPSKALDLGMVHATGLEPAQPLVWPLPPQGSVSTNSTTRAWYYYIILLGFWGY